MIIDSKSQGANRHSPKHTRSYTELPPLKAVGNKLYYAFRRNGWMLNPKFIRGCPDQVIIDRPVFLLGTQGGGLTLVSRMLRRHPCAVSITGNHRYWAGADEMQNVANLLLPPQLTGIRRNFSDLNDFPRAKEWLYATNDFLRYYRGHASQATEAMKRRFRCIIKSAIERYADDVDTARFIDKSQLYTVKVPLLTKLLSGCNPQFVLITRNPYAICPSRARNTPSLRGLSGRMTFEERLELAAQHWANSMHCALQDADRQQNLLVVRFEDVLQEAEATLRRLCSFTEMEFQQSMIPSATDEIPFGSLRRNRWFPLRPDVNDRHVNLLTATQIDIIANTCASLASRFEYPIPCRILSK